MIYSNLYTGTSAPDNRVGINGDFYFDGAKLWQKVSGAYVVVYGDFLISDRGGYDASSNTFPTTGGTGAGGAIERGNQWYITVAGTLGGVAVGVGSRIMAKVDAPATDADWLVTPFATGTGGGDGVGGKLYLFNNY